MASDLAGRNYAGIDTHKDTHVVAVIDSIGRLIDTAAFLTTARGYNEL